jgi:hypothetical protein
VSLPFSMQLSTPERIHDRHAVRRTPSAGSASR